MVTNTIPNDGSYVLTQILNIITIHSLGSFLKRKAFFHLQSVSMLYTFDLRTI